ncbi:HAD-IIA family hydrolase [Actinosynnema sp. NPDC047251]|uniref:HAD-superfamily hydrolase, subfamily IIA n=1 Tax=Saccharothrix espanaensis (strain ATCC 51144 / DSM 44229 / JCM 9112 / NBRC 15066 / NRRL 15764) TaxID=1179773 RepID=K0K0P5_SACES|nr:HAD-superfamily hydrolase, subfamily IIA [Saccharothrix espanaensis DSM 44229]
MLLDRYDALLLDLDGTVYRGHDAVPGAVEAVAAARGRGIGIRFVTNNATRSPQDVADHLTEIGFRAALDEVSTSAQAAAAMLPDLVGPGAGVLVLGTDALADEVRRCGFTPVRTAEGAAAVVQGLSQDLGWRELAEAALAIRAGARWVACNVDATLPTERGLLPGNGSLVAALKTATGAEPLVAGKPATPLLEQAAKSLGAQRPLVVGDRLDTDILGAVNAGLDSLLVLTGVSTEADAAALPPHLRPTYVAADLSVLDRLP